jgi:uncharacterized protein (DUF2235 family)
MPKNIVIFSDGTGQKGGEGFNTNIYKMFNMVEDRTDNQIAFYDPGLGTGKLKITGLISGAGIEKNIKECYKFIFQNYKAGDKIFLFGFSRGATTVRSLSGFLYHFGILPSSRADLIEEAYEIYKQYKPDPKNPINSHPKWKEKAESFINRHHTMWVKVHFLGCFDTVAALGFPIHWVSQIIDAFPVFKHNYHNLRLSKSVLNAYHALAIDDDRKTFHPKIWDNKLIEGQKMKQVWFCGSHSDVGGGYKEDKISSIPLVWMTQMAVNEGLLIYDKHKQMINEDIEGFIHNPRKFFPMNLTRRQERIWTHADQKPILHASVLERKKNSSNEDSKDYNPWIKNLSLGFEVEPWVKIEDQIWKSKKQLSKSEVIP